MNAEPLPSPPQIPRVQHRVHVSPLQVIAYRFRRTERPRYHSPSAQLAEKLCEFFVKSTASPNQISSFGVVGFATVGVPSRDEKFVPTVALLD